MNDEGKKWGNTYRIETTRKIKTVILVLLIIVIIIVIIIIVIVIIVTVIIIVIIIRSYQKFFCCWWGGREFGEQWPRSRSLADLRERRRELINNHMHNAHSVDIQSQKHGHVSVRHICYRKERHIWQNRGTKLSAITSSLQLWWLFGIKKKIWPGKPPSKCHMSKRASNFYFVAKNL